ncbi:MAG: ABC transporter ATP-binding protein, partial [Clostridiales bacterium]|nr:ABC transporter ATP-binding protein [Clostridiales bacterium]
MSDAKALSVKNLCKSFDVDKTKFPVLTDISLDIEPGEFITIVGHSGCGKSTLLKIIAGLVDYEIGEVTYDGKKITGPGKERGMVFQDHRLLPWLTIRENIGFGLYRMSAGERRRLVDKMLETVGIESFANAYPGQLSGGMAQRAAIARALITNPSVLLLDEPFGALDALTRIQMQKETLEIWRREKTTMILVTHDIDEAIFLGARVVALSPRPGEIRKIISIHTVKDRKSPDFAIY